MFVEADIGRTGEIAFNEFKSVMLSIQKSSYKRRKSVIGSGVQFSF
jgi:hypothetical protein